MARRKRKYKRRKKKTIPILPLIGLGIGVAKPVSRAVKGDFNGALGELRNTVLLMDEHGNFHMEWAKYFWAPVIGGVIGHKVATMLGVNKWMTNLPSPLNKLRL